MRKKIIALMCIISMIFLLSSCVKDSEDETEPENTTSTEVTTDNTSDDDNVVEDVKDEDLSKAEDVVNGYFEAMSKNNLEEVNKFWVDEYKVESLLGVEVENIDVISLKPDETGKHRSGFTSGRGTKLEYTDVICLIAKYNIQYTKDTEKKATEDSGEYEKCVTLVKKTDDSQWQIAEIGY